MSIEINLVNEFNNCQSRMGGIKNMSLVKEYFYNIKCDVCGCLSDDELWKADSQGA